MTPYYQHAGITIYHADCREVLPHVTADALVTDLCWDCWHRWHEEARP